MADIHRLPDVREAEREASEWIARLDADDASDHDRLQFKIWRETHPVHARAYQELSETMRLFIAAGTVARASDRASDRRRPLRRWMLAAAGVAVVVGLVGGLYVLHLTSQSTLSTAVGEQATITLPDGSTLELNSNSIAHVDYSPRSRIIRLERGEAFFKVAHDSQRPFWVRGEGSWVRAVGTAFDVYESPRGVYVTVGEGTVKVVAGQSPLGKPPSDDTVLNSAWALTAGQQANLDGTTKAIRALSAAELAQTISWRDGTLYFENQALSEIVADLSRYTTLKLMVADPSLRGLQLGGTFKANPEGAEALLALLRQGLDLEVRREGERVYIEPARR